MSSSDLSTLTENLLRISRLVVWIRDALFILKMNVHFTHDKRDVSVTSVWSHFKNTFSVDGGHSCIIERVRRDDAWLVLKVRPGYTIPKTRDVLFLANLTLENIQHDDSYLVN